MPVLHAMGGTGRNRKNDDTISDVSRPHSRPAFIEQSGERDYGVIRSIVCAALSASALSLIAGLVLMLGGDMTTAAIVCAGSLWGALAFK